MGNVEYFDGDVRCLHCGIVHQHRTVYILPPTS